MMAGRDIGPLPGAHIDLLAGQAIVDLDLPALDGDAALMSNYADSEMSSLDDGGKDGRLDDEMRLAGWHDVELNLTVALQDGGHAATILRYRDLAVRRDDHLVAAMDEEHAAAGAGYQ